MTDIITVLLTLATLALMFGAGMTYQAMRFLRDRDWRQRLQADTVDQIADRVQELCLQQTHAQTMLARLVDALDEESERNVDRA